MTIEEIRVRCVRQRARHQDVPGQAVVEVSLPVSDVLALLDQVQDLRAAVNHAIKELAPWCRDTHYYGGDMDGALEHLERVVVQKGEISK